MVIKCASVKTHALGPDGFNITSYHKTWSIIKEDIEIWTTFNKLTCFSELEMPLYSPNSKMKVAEG